MTNEGWWRARSNLLSASSIVTFGKQILIGPLVYRRISTTCVLAYAKAEMIGRQLPPLKYCEIVADTMPRVRSDHIYLEALEALEASQMLLKIRPRSQSAQPPLRARMKADGVCETRIRSVGRGAGSSRVPTAVGHAARSQGRGAGVHLPLH